MKEQDAIIILEDLLTSIGALNYFKPKFYKKYEREAHKSIDILREGFGESIFDKLLQRMRVNNADA